MGKGVTDTYVPGRVGVVGLGLIGGSFAKAFAKAGSDVYAWNRTHEVTELACIDTITGELTDEVISTCELVIVSLFPEACVDWLSAHVDDIAPGAIVIDAAGVKRVVCERCFEVAQGHPFTFCGAHPMAGTQYAGYAHSRANLYHGAPMVLCPPTDMDDVDRLEVLDRLERLLGPCGFGEFSITTPKRHDELIAFTSQLAHVVSNAYVKSPTAAHQGGFSAGSYKDLTRVARCNPTMWSELFIDDADNLSFEVGHLIDELGRFKDAIDARDEEALTGLLAEGDRLKREAERR
ncbi:MAG: prephenate dehydrogenase [Atopobiaceae bacterium]|jgi:prephenate dehydrogenase|nr:prephenate dehydrogenase [Atopobiaceae bacterium]MCH4180081.1 prephenate dehydrogenase [Atopobiaceae bacterium]MCH4213867.1 prephenate dehydrogenase [Atopobiaceae bacterium]MCH4229969.1 prephenate dehydrogenase [Atopobiaceae bacterium]MCH4275670.1 prephenate dehydrogenase [Atopobiaceae bacterium]